MSQGLSCPVSPMGIPGKGKEKPYSAQVGGGGNDVVDGELGVCKWTVLT